MFDRRGRLWVGTPLSAVLDWTLLIVPGLIWGASFLFIAEGLEALAPDGVTFMRFVVGFLTLSFVPAARRPIEPGDRLGVFGLSVLWLAFPMSMFPHAGQHVSSALTGMLTPGNITSSGPVGLGIIPRPAIETQARGTRMGRTCRNCISWHDITPGRAWLRRSHEED